MANNYYTFGGPFIPSTKVRSGQVNPEFAGVESAFDLLPGASDAITRGVTELGIDVQGGTVNEFDVAMPDTRLTNQEGDLVVFRATHTNDGPVVINVDTIGDIAAVEFDGDAFLGGEIVTGRVYEFRYDNANTQFVLSQSTDGANQVISATDWATRPEDDPIPVSSGGDGVTDFSALHYAAKSAQFGGGLDFAGDHDASGGDPASPATGNPLFRIVTSGGVITGAGQVEIGDDIYWNGVDWNRINNQPGSFTQGSGSDDPTSPGTFDAQFQWQNSLGDLLAQVGFNSDTIFTLKNFVHGGQLHLKGEASGGSEVTFAVFDPSSNGNQIFHNASQPGHRVIQTTNLGVDIYNIPTSPTAATAIGLVTGFSDLFIGVITGDPDNNFLAIEAGVDQEARLDLFATDTALNEVLMADFDAQAGPARLYHSDAAGTTVATIRTASLASGGAEVNNTLTGGGFERVLTTADIVAPGAANLNELSDVTLTAPDTGGVLYKSAGDWLDTPAVTIDPTAAISLAFNTNIAVTTTALGVDIRAPSGDNDPTLRLIEDATLSTILSHDISTDITILRNEVNSGHVQIRGRSSAGGDELLFSGDPDNQSIMYWDGTQRIRAAQQGLEVIGLGASSGAVRIFQNNGTTLIGLLSFSSSQGEIQMLNNNGAAFQITGPDTGATPRTMFRADPDNTAAMYHQGEIQIITRDDGMEVRGEGSNNPASGLTQDIFIRLVNDAIQEAGGIEFPGSIDMNITNRVHGGDLLLRAEDAGGVLRTLFTGDPDGESALYHIGSVRLNSATTGIVVTGDGADISSIQMEDSAAAIVGLIDITGSQMLIECQVDSNDIRIQGRNSSSAARTFILMDPNGNMQFFHAVDNVIVARTVPLLSGGLQVQNTDTGAGFERVLTQSDSAITATTTELEDITDDINTNARKVAGYEVFNTTTSIVVWAVGAGDGSLWLNATGATAHTPV